MNYRPLYGVPGYLYDCETGNVVRMIHGEKKCVPTFFINGEEYIPLPNGKNVRLKSLFRRRNSR
jgi:hypothetical protein